MRDIARLSGASIATVSRVINNPEKVSRRTYDKVMNVIKENRYTPNQSAVNLFSGESKSIAIFVYDLGNPFYSSLVHHLNNIAFRHGYMLLVCDAGGNPEIEARFYRYCVGIRISGIVLTIGSAQGVPVEDLSSSIPLVCIDRESFGTQPCYSVQSDYENGTRLLIDNLYRLNHRKIGYITGTTGFISSAQRTNSFLNHMRRLGLDVPNRYLYEGEFSVQCGVSSFDYFYSMSDPPTAIITADDQIARGFIMRANALGVAIPDEFSVCGMDAVDSSIFYPPITSIQQNIYAISHAAFDFIYNFPIEPPPCAKVIGVSIYPGQTCHKIPLNHHTSEK